MNNSKTEYNGVIVCGPPASPDPDYTYHNIVTICGQPASPDPEDIYNGKQVSPSPEMMNYQTITTYGTPPSAYTVVTQVRGPSTPPNPVVSRIAVSPKPEMINYETVTGYESLQTAYSVGTYERSRITQYSPISPAESYTYSENRFESSNFPGPELLSTPVKESASNCMMEPHVVTPTTSKKRSPRRHLNFRNPNLMYDLEDISDDESNSGEPLAQKPMTEDIVMDNESMRAWISAIANIYKSRNE